MGFIKFHNLNLVAQARIFLKCGNCIKSDFNAECSICGKAIKYGDVIWKYQYNRRDYKYTRAHQDCVLKFSYKDATREICDKVQDFLNINDIYYYNNIENTL